MTDEIKFTRLRDLKPEFSEYRFGTFDAIDPQLKTGAYDYVNVANDAEAVRVIIGSEIKIYDLKDGIWRNRFTGKVAFYPRSPVLRLLYRLKIAWTIIKTGRISN